MIPPATAAAAALAAEQFRAAQYVNDATGRVLAAALRCVERDPATGRYVLRVSPDALLASVFKGAA